METNSAVQDKFKVYYARWIVLAIYSVMSMGNSALWVTFAPISNITSNYFGGGYYGSATSVNMLANIFLILFAPGTIFGVLIMKKFHLRTTLLFGGIITVIGALLRYIATLSYSSLGDGGVYALLFVGQSLAAIVQPIFVNLPPAIASIWFPVEERDIATTISSMSFLIGNAIGQVIPAAIVTQNQDDPGSNSQRSLESNDDGATVEGMADLMLVEFLVCTVPLILAFLLVKNSPPTPPSQSTLLKLQKMPKNQHGEHVAVEQLQDPSAESSEFSSEWSQFVCDVRTLFRDRDYVLLFMAFSIGAGFFNALMTLLNQIVLPFGYSNDNAGTFAAVFIFAGLVGAGIAAYILEKTRRYRLILKSLILLCVLLLVILLSLLYHSNLAALTVFFGIFGFFLLPIVPVTMENCAECTYPISEDLSMGLLFAGCNVIGLGFIFAIQYLLEVAPLGPPPFLPSNIFMIGIFVTAAMILMFFNGQYKRYTKEILNNKEDDRLRRSDDEGGAATSLSVATNGDAIGANRSTVDVEVEVEEEKSDRVGLIQHDSDRVRSNAAGKGSNGKDAEKGDMEMKNLL